MSITINPPAGPWTVDDIGTLPEAGYRVEIHEGKLVMMSPATMWHSRTIRRLTNVLEAAGRPVGMEVGVKRSKSDMRVADVAMFHEEQRDLHKAYWEPKELAVAIEVVSESSEEDDRVYKPRWYAKAGIPEYWRVEEGDGGEAVILQYKLAHAADGTAAYIESGVTTLSNLEAGSGTPNE